MRSFRSAVMGISPPDLRRAGLAAALADLTAPLVAEGLEAELAVPDGMDLPPDVEALLFRASREGIRNVVTHAQAQPRPRDGDDGGSTVWSWRSATTVWASPRATRAPSGTGTWASGCSESSSTDAGGTLDVTSAPNGRGTLLRVEVPVP